MAIIIAITNQKGGVGKTTTSINLAAALALLDKRVLLVDLDPQGNSTTGFGIRHDEVQEDIFNVLVDDVPLKDIIKETSAKNVMLAPSTVQLAAADIILEDRSAKESLLKEKIESITVDFDYVIIDCPPSLGLLNKMGLTAADGVVIPVQAQHYALEGVKLLFGTIQNVQRNYNPKLTIKGLLTTMFDSRTILSEDVHNLIISTFGDRAYKTVIPQNTRLAEAPMFGKSIFDYDKSSKGAIAYLELAKEVVKQDE